MQMLVLNLSPAPFEHHVIIASAHTGEDLSNLTDIVNKAVDNANDHDLIDELIEDFLLEYGFVETGFSDDLDGIVLDEKVVKDVLYFCEQLEEGLADWGLDLWVNSDDHGVVAFSEYLELAQI